MRLLLVEDDVMIGESVLDLLRADGFAVDWVKDGQMASSALIDHAYDAVILDLGLPKLGGMALLTQLRAGKDHTPVLITTAHDALQQRIAGLNAGADDYVLKPYEYEELLARIRALIRRTSGHSDATLEFQNVAVNLVAKTLTVDGYPVSLQAKEWAILEILLARPGHVYSRKQLEDKLYGWRDEVSSNAVEVHIHGLRKKLGADFIKTIRGVGYLIPKAQA